jgi:hypothetical protein
VGWTLQSHVTDAISWVKVMGREVNPLGGAIGEEKKKGAAQ